MQHLSEVLKILEGGLSFNAQTVVNYAQALIRKLQADGEGQQARLIQSKLDGAATKLAALDASPSVPVDQESKFDLGDVEHLSPGDSHAVLDDHIRSEVDRFLRFAQASDQLTAAGVGIAPRMIIYGPPGVGKTQLARYISAELRLPLITARSDSLISSFLGSTAKNIRRLFDHAGQRPCVLFLDEFDALAKARDDAQELGELKRIVVSLLQNIDSLPPPCVLLAATNHQQLLDAAVWRRFPYRIQMDLPRPELREALMRAYLRNYVPDQGLNYATVLSEGLSGGSIREACEDAIRETILIHHDKVQIGSLLRRLAATSLIAQQLTPTDATIARALLNCDVPQRTASSAAGLSMRQVAKLSRDVSEVGIIRGGPGGTHAIQDSAKPRIRRSARSRIKTDSRR